MYKFRRELQRIGNHVLGGPLIYFLLPLIRRLRNTPSRPDSLLILKLDAPGDYILFRNFLEDLRQSHAYARHHITLVGNPRWRDIATHWDACHVDQFIWLDPRRFRREPWYRFRTLSRFDALDFETLIVPTHSRTRLMDHLAGRIKAQLKIAPQGDRVNLGHYPTHDSTRCYTHLLACRDETHFEFQRNREFFEQLLNQTIHRRIPHLPDCEPPESIRADRPYAVLVPGAGHRSRQWPAESFAEVARNLDRDYRLAVILVGTCQEEVIGRVITEHCPAVLNRIGQTHSDTLVELIAHSELVITNETAAIHIAAALRKTVLCISNGSHFGRFHPYPADLDARPQFIYPQAIEEKWENIEELVQMYSADSPLDIHSITVEQVTRKIAALLDQAKE